MSPASTPTWVTILGLVITAFGVWAAQAWATRGKKVVDTSTLALDMVEKLTERVEGLERVDTWRTVVHIMDSDYIALLRDWIYRAQPPPPPERPVYPPRPS